jgi:hypothetical protein
MARVDFIEEAREKGEGLEDAGPVGKALIPRSTPVVQAQILLAVGGALL